MSLQTNIERGVKFFGLERKYNKLKKDPEAFVRDMLIKRKAQVEKYIPMPKHKGGNHYTIITSCKNNGDTLNEYFESIVDQSIDFKKYISIICIDNASTDNTKRVIAKWRRKYPKNIKYVYAQLHDAQEVNNLGLSFVQTEWVTFIKARDFIDRRYFEEVDQALCEQGDDIILVNNNVLDYVENKKQYKSTHELRYRFSEKVKALEVDKLGKNVEVSIASSFFRMSKIKGIRFEAGSDFMFDEIDFIVRYLVDNGQSASKVLLLKDAHYYNRKKNKAESIFDNYVKNKAFYLNNIENYLTIFAYCTQKLGVVPQYVQHTILYMIMHIFKYNLNVRDVDVLTNKEREKFFKLMKDLCAYMEDSIIFSHSLNRAYIYYRIILLDFFKESKFSKYNVYLEKYDSVKDEVLLSQFGYHDVLTEFLVDGNEVYGRINKKVKYELFGRDVCYQYRTWLPLQDKQAKKLAIKIRNKTIRIVYDKKLYGSSIDLKLVKAKTSDISQPKSNAWLIMDRDVQADDNGEHFYRYMMNNHAEQPCYFALDQKSHDWKRLKNEGFKLVAFNSHEFDYLMKTSDKVISSHTYATNYFGGDSLAVDFVFLQHGVIHNDHSKFYNGRSTLSKFITTTQDEYNDLAGNDSYYHLTEKEVVLSGLPRHDALLAHNNTNNKTILIMPTWRRDIIGESTGNGLDKEKNANFMSTEYARRWSSVLNSNVLRRMVKEHGYKVIFAPHKEIEKYLDVFTYPEYISTWYANLSTIQELFQNSTMMITDYSSVSFEMAYLKKPVLYYQFDIDGFYGVHYKKGYFDYPTHGFGPAVESETALLSELQLILDNNGQPREPYLSRIEATFPYRDGKCSERVYEAIMDLNKDTLSIPDIGVYKEKVLEAERFEDYLLVKKRCQAALSCFKEAQEKDLEFFEEKLFISYCKQHDWIAVERILSKMEKIHPVINMMPLLIAKNKWEDAIEYCKKHRLNTKNKAINLYYLYASMHLDKKTIFKREVKKHDDSPLMQLFTLYSEKKWKAIKDGFIKDDAIDYRMLNAEKWLWQDVAILPIFVNTTINLKSLDLCHKLIDAYVEKSGFDLTKSLQVSKYYFASGKFALVLKALLPIYRKHGIGYFSHDICKIFVASLHKEEKMNLIADNYNAIRTYLSESNNHDSLVLLFNGLKKYNALVELFSDRDRSKQPVDYYLDALYMTGNFKPLYEILLEYPKLTSYNLYKLSFLTAWAVGDMKMANDAIQHIFNRYEHVDKEKNIELYREFVCYKNLFESQSNA